MYFVCRHVKAFTYKEDTKYYQAIIETYPCFIEAVIEFKRHLRNYFANFVGEECKVDPSDETTYYPKDFRLVKDPQT